MIENSQDKMQREQKIKEPYHFAGTGVHPPMTILAESQAEAVAIYKKKVEELKANE